MKTHRVHPSFANVTSQRFINTARKTFNNASNEKSFSIDLILSELKRVYGIRDITRYKENLETLKAQDTLSEMKKSGHRNITLNVTLNMVPQIHAMADRKQSPARHTPKGL